MGSVVRGATLDSESNEFGRPQRREADLDVHDAVVDLVLGHRVGSALHEVRLVGRSPGEGALTKERREEAIDRLPDGRPQWLVVRLEDDPLRALLDAVLEVDQQPPDAYVPPFRIVA